VKLTGQKFPKEKGPRWCRMVSRCWTNASTP